MKDRRNRIVGAIVSAIIIVFLIIFKQGSVTDSFIEEFNLQEITGIKQVYVYNDFDGVPAVGTYVYKYELNDIEIDYSDWEKIPFDEDYIVNYLQLANLEITDGYYVYNQVDNKEDSYYYFDIAILDTNNNILYHMLHKSS